MTRTLSVSLIVAALVSTVSSFSITSPDICISNLDCRTNSFCNDTDFSQLPRCIPRLPPEAPCDRVGLIECKQGFTCLFDDTIPGDNPICRSRRPRGAKCRLDATRPCARSLICERNTTTCQPFKDGFAGTPCQFDRHCQQDKGFYCQTDPGVCAPKRGPGGECGRRADNFECLGFCVSRSFNEGICISGRRDGDLCTEDSICQNPFFERLNPRANLLICNRPKGAAGRCVRESRLLKRLGAECDPDNDRCDARRALSCSPTRRGRHVCQHRISRFDAQFLEFPQFCNPQSRLSRCPWGDEKTECRRERLVPGQSLPFGSGVSPFFLCRRRSERVPPGGICMKEYADCVSGTECREVPGVEPEESSPFDRFPKPRVPFCVRIVEKGGSCGGVKDKFTTQCAQGFRCEEGKCVKAEGDEPPLDEAVTHAGIGALCASLPCAPGLVCEKGEFDSTKRCVLPLRIVGKGWACTDRARERRRCADGLVCALRKDGTNVRRCRVPRKEGDYCELEDDCAKGLTCSVSRLGNREREERRCYDPTLTLKIGETCDPKAPRSQPGCVIDERPDPDFPRDTITQPMRCVAKGDEFACRVVVGFFDFCDEAKDFTCDAGLKCGSLGVCVPVGET